MKQKNWQYKAVIVGLAVVLGGIGRAQAQSGDAVLDLLVKKGVITQREANEVREQADAQAAQTVETYSKVKTASWLDALTFSGDLRLRADSINYEQDPSTGKSYLPNQLLFRYRLRLGVEAKFVEWATLNVRLMSGGTDAGNSVSGNQTYTGTFQKFGVNVDVASVTLQVPGHDEAKVIVGKMENPLWAPKFGSPLIWDNDVTPSGVAEQLQWSFGDNKQYRVFAQAGQYVVNALSTERDNYLFDQQGGVEVKFGKDPKNPKLKMTAAAGYFVTDNLGLVKAGSNTASSQIGTTLVAAGTSTNYLGNVQVGYARAEVVWQVAEQSFLGTPNMFTFSGEYLKNFASIYGGSAAAYQASNDSDQTTGWALQAAYGDSKKKGQWLVLYQYKFLQANAVWDAITDSDFGTGGTDRKGHVIKASYNVFDWWQVAFTSFISTKISDFANPNGKVANHDQYGWTGENQLRIQADTTFKF